MNSDTQFSRRLFLKNSSMVAASIGATVSVGSTVFSITNLMAAQKAGSFEVTYTANEWRKIQIGRAHV